MKAQREERRARGKDNEKERLVNAAKVFRTLTAATIKTTHVNLVYGFRLIRDFKSISLQQKPARLQHIRDRPGCKDSPNCRQFHPHSCERGGVEKDGSKLNLIIAL